jgi:hypothetical protein
MRFASVFGSQTRQLLQIKERFVQEVFVKHMVQQAMIIVSSKADP